MERLSVCLMTGTLDIPFDRMIRAFFEMPGIEDVYGLAQCGVFDPNILAKAPWKGMAVDFCDEATLAQSVADADVVVSHAGIGCICLAAEHNKPIVLVPRQKRFAEHYDDHQSQICDYLRARDDIFICRDQEELHRLVEAARKVESNTRDILNSLLLPEYVASRFERILKSRTAAG